MEQHSVLEIVERVKQALMKRGVNSIRSIGRNFKLFDSFDGNRKVDKDEFRVGLKENGILMDFFDRNKDGVIDYDEFLFAIRGKPNQRRQIFIDKAFLKFDKDGNGYIDAYDLKDSFDCSYHPKVQSGEISKQQVLQDFLISFGDTNRDGRIVKQEWDEYYAGVSASIDNDDHFVMLMKKTWKLE